MKKLINGIKKEFKLRKSVVPPPIVKISPFREKAGVLGACAAVFMNL